MQSSNPTVKLLNKKSEDQLDEYSSVKLALLELLLIYTEYIWLLYSLYQLASRKLFL